MSNGSKAILRAKTPESKQAAGGDVIVLDTFPFRVGRESRSSSRDKDRRSGGQPTNDLYLRDSGDRLQVSREHFQIERSGDGQYELVDRGSACGTIVNGRPVGGDRQGGRCSLTPGSTIVVGTSHSRFVFEFDIQSGV